MKVKVKVKVEGKQWEMMAVMEIGGWRFVGVVGCDREEGRSEE